MAKAWDFMKEAVNVYVDFVQDWPGFVAIAWPVTLIVVAVYF